MPQLVKGGKWVFVGLNVVLYAFCCATLALSLRSSKWEVPFDPAIEALTAPQCIGFGRDDKGQTAKAFLVLSVDLVRHALRRAESFALGQ